MGWRSMKAFPGASTILPDWRWRPSYSDPMAKLIFLPFSSSSSPSSFSSSCCCCCLSLLLLLLLQLLLAACGSQSANLIIYIAWHCVSCSQLCTARLAEPMTSRDSLASHNNGKNANIRDPCHITWLSVTVETQSPLSCLYGMHFLPRFITPDSRLLYFINCPVCDNLSLYQKN